MHISKPEKFQEEIQKNQENIQTYSKSNPKVFRKESPKQNQEKIQKFLKETKQMRKGSKVVNK